MSIIPSHLARVPNFLSTQVMLGSLNRTNQDLLRTQIQLASGRLINRPSDDAVGASAISVLDDVLERREQRLRNMSHAQAVLGNVDQSVGDATNIVQEARAVGLSQIGVGSDAATRQSEAKVIDAMLNELFSIANRSVQGLHFFAGDRTAVPPFQKLHTGIVYQGTGSGLVTDLGVINPFPITISGDEAFGALSSRVKGDQDLDPSMVEATRLADLNGALGFGIRLGSIDIDVNGNNYELDLSSASTVGDVITAIEDLLNTNEPGALGPNGMTIDAATGDRFNIDLNPGFVLTINETGLNSAAADLGLTGASFEDGVNEVGADVDPRLTELTPMSSLPGVTVPLGTIRIANGDQTRDVDLSAVTNVQELMNAVKELKIGVRVEIAASGDRLNFVNELSGGRMSIAEVGGGTTATEFGVRSFTGTTRLEDFNDGRGVHIVSGSVDPITGLPDPSRDLDFRVTVKDGRTFDVDLASAGGGGGSAETVQDVLDAINAAAGAAGLGVPAEFNAALAPDGNGIVLTDVTVGAPGSAISVTSLNGSFAAEDLGIKGSTTGATLTGEDRATVAVESVFGHLIALRDALESDDERGIEFATQRLEGDIDRLARARADIGVRAQRVDRLTDREAQLKIQDTALRSEIQDLDFAEAATRFSSLQTQLQAGLQVTSRALSLSLIDFLR